MNGLLVLGLILKRAAHCIETEQQVYRKRTLVEFTMVQLIAFQV